METQQWQEMDLSGGGWGHLIDCLCFGMGVVGKEGNVRQDWNQQTIQQGES